MIRSSTAPTKTPTASVVLVSLLLGACSAGGATGSTRAEGRGGSSSTGGSDGTGPGGLVVGGGSGGGLNVSGGGGPGQANAAVPTPDCTKACPDFPKAPLFDDKSNPPVVGADVSAFADPKNFTPGAYCVTEPQLSSGTTPGALFPANWLRPRFTWSAPAGDTLFEIRLHNEIEANDLVAYTHNHQWLMPKAIWQEVGLNVHTPITVTIRGTGGSGVDGVQGTFQVAPVNAGGNMIFWATNTKAVTPTASTLVNFTVGDEAVASTLTLQQVQTTGIIDENGQNLRLQSNKPGFTAGQVQCIGCHVSTPDGESVIFGDDWPWDKVTASVTVGNEGKLPSYVTPAARVLLMMPWQGIATMTKAHWATGDRILVTSFADRTAPFPGGREAGEGLVWFDLETTAPLMADLGYNAMQARNTAITMAKGTAWGSFTLQGETGAAVTPNVSNDGANIVYTSTVNPENGALSKSLTNVFADIHMVPYGARMGGTVTPVAGASDPSVWEYYPSFSSDDAFIAFNRIATHTVPPYYNPDGEIYVVPSKGGTAARLAANDPPACTGQTSPGVTNSWAKWSPRAELVDGKRYYFLVFSSARKYDGQFQLVDPYGESQPANSSQLYLAAFVADDATGQITSYPAVYLWNQDNLAVGDQITVTATTNLTPAWGEFVIPPVTAVIK